VAGDELPADGDLIKPMQKRYIDQLTSYGVEDFRGRVTQPGDRVYSSQALLCQDLPGGGADLALVIGYGMSEDRRQVPRLHEPHSFNVAWVRATPGEGVLRHRYDNTSVLIVKSGSWEVTLNDGDQAQTVRLDPQDALSVPQGSWRSYQLREPGENAATPGTGELLVVNSGDARVRQEWAPDVVEAAFDSGWLLDPNGYLAPVAVMINAAEDD
jgi:mannose-6-phosphate isomerase-like protein (cupin superfamily)